MYYESTGAGKPSVVFVHGFACDHTDWPAQVKALSGSHRVVTCDLRGHGRTPAPPDECTIETYGADVAELVESLDLAPAVLAGHSMGCRVVLEAARLRPENVKGLVLIDGSCTASGDPEAAEKKLRDKVKTMGYAAFAEERFDDMFPVPYGGAEKLIERSRRLPAQVGSVLFPRMSRWDAQHMDAALRAVKVPMMVIQSTYLGPSLHRETLQPGQTSPWLDKVREHAPHARMEIVPGVGHFVHMEAADKVNALLLDFLGD